MFYVFSTHFSIDFTLLYFRHFTDVYRTAKPKTNDFKYLLSFEMNKFPVPGHINNAEIEICIDRVNRSARRLFSYTRSLACHKHSV